MTTREINADEYTNEEPASGADELVNLLREYRNAEQRTRLKIRRSMGIGENDVEALRYLLHAHGHGETPRQRDFAKILGISDASVSGLIDRLCRQGYAQRVTHPKDRRSAGVVPTSLSNNEIRKTFDQVHRKTYDAAAQLSPEERVGAARFLRLLADSLEDTTS